MLLLLVVPLSLIIGLAFYGVGTRMNKGKVVPAVLGVLGAIAMFLWEPIMHQIAQRLVRDWYLELLRSGPDAPIILGNVAIGFIALLTLAVLLSWRTKSVGDASPSDSA